MSRTKPVISGLLLGVISIACAAACSSTSPSATPSGSQQTPQGTSGQTGTPAAAGATAAPLQTAAGAKKGAAGHAAAAISGKDITAVGDSVMLAVAYPLEQAFPGISVDAVVSRHTDEGLSELRRLAANGKLRPVLIVGLGTNGGVSSDQVSQLMTIVGNKRTVVLVNTFVPLPYEQSTNSVLAAAPHTYRNVVLANWDQAISGHTSMLRPDGIHPLPPGARVYVSMIKAALAQAPQTAPAGG
jgi:hypothetical protein